MIVIDVIIKESGITIIMMMGIEIDKIITIEIVGDSEEDVVEMGEEEDEGDLTEIIILEIAIRITIIDKTTISIRITVLEITMTSIIRN